MKEQILKLIKDFESDSKKRSESAKDPLEDIIRKYINEKYKLYSKYKFKQDWIDDDYRTDRGYLELKDIDYSNVLDKIPSKTEFRLHYSDSWSYGGSCDADITIKLIDILNWDAIATEKKLQQDQLHHLKTLVKVHEKKLLDSQKNLKDFKTLYDL